MGYGDGTTGGTTELRVHGVSGTPPEATLDHPHTERVAGDADAGFYRRGWGAAGGAQGAAPGRGGGGGVGGRRAGRASRPGGRGRRGRPARHARRPARGVLLGRPHLRRLEPRALSA